MQAMIHHHGQAILMTKWVPKRSPGPDIPLLAKRMQNLAGVGDRADAELAPRTRREAQEPVGPPGPRPRHRQGTAARDADVDASSAGSSTPTARAFDRLFLRDMTYHHNGALAMVQQLAAKGGGMEPEISAFTRHVEADQEIEIARMQKLMTELR